MLYILVVMQYHLALYKLVMQFAYSRVLNRAHLLIICHNYTHLHLANKKILDM